VTPKPSTPQTLTPIPQPPETLTRNLKLPYSQPETRNPKPETRNPRYRVKGAGYRVQGVGYRVYGARCLKPELESRYAMGFADPYELFASDPTGAMVTLNPKP